MTAKQEAQSLLEKLPDNCSIEDIFSITFMYWKRWEVDWMMHARMAPSHRKMLSHAWANG